MKGKYTPEFQTGKGAGVLFSMAYDTPTPEQLELAVRRAVDTSDLTGQELQNFIMGWWVGFYKHQGLFSKKGLNHV